jgi:hypothetical protein
MICISSTNVRHPVTKSSLHFTQLHFASLHLSTLHFLLFKLQTPVNHPEEGIQPSKWGENLKSRKILTYLLTPWSRVLLGRTLLVKKFPAFYRTRRFITAFTSARHLSLSWASSVHIIYVWKFCLRTSCCDNYLVNSPRFACTKACKASATVGWFWQNWNWPAKCPDMKLRIPCSFVSYLLWTDWTVERNTAHY